MTGSFKPRGAMNSLLTNHVAVRRRLLRRQPGLAVAGPARQLGSGPRSWSRAPRRRPRSPPCCALGRSVIQEGDVRRRRAVAERNHGRAGLAAGHRTTRSRPSPGRHLGLERCSTHRTSRTGVAVGGAGSRPVCAGGWTGAPGWCRSSRRGARPCRGPARRWVRCGPGGGRRADQSGRSDPGRLAWAVLRERVERRTLVTDDEIVPTPSAGCGARSGRGRTAGPRIGRAASADAGHHLTAPCGRGGLRRERRRAPGLTASGSELPDSTYVSMI